MLPADVAGIPNPFKGVGWLTLVKALIVLAAGEKVTAKAIERMRYQKEAAN